MRLTVFAPEGEFSRSLKSKLDLFEQIEASWITPSDFVADLAEAAAEGSPLIVYLTPELLPDPLPSPRILWQALLERNTPAEYGFFLPGGFRLPPLLQSSFQSPHAGADRGALRWIVSWLSGERSTTPPPSEELLAQLVDQPGVASLEEDPTALLAPYFERVIHLRVDHQSPVLREAALASIQSAGRALYVLTGSAEITPPPGASIVQLPSSTLPPATLADAALWLSRISPGEALPLSTFELEQLLLGLFPQHYELAERLARRAASCLRNSGRQAEAIWAYETLKSAAAAHSAWQTVRDCDDELYWLRTAGPRPEALKQAVQGNLF